MNDLKMTCIINIQNMQKIIGCEQSGLKSLEVKSYDELHEQQNALISDYNKMVAAPKPSEDQYLLDRHISIVEKEGSTTLSLENVTDKEWIVEQFLARGYAVSQDYPRLNINLIQ